MPFFLTLRSVQTLSNPKVVDGIKMELFGATTIIRKIILEGGLVAVDDGSRSGSGTAVRANDASFIDFETTNCKTKLDGKINAINALTASVKEMTYKRGAILSKKISYPYTPLEIKVAKRRRKDISKASSSIKKSKIVDVTTEATTEEHNITVDNPSTASKKKVKPHIDVIFHYLRKKAKLQTPEQYRYTIDNYLYKVYINNAYDRYCQQQLEVFGNEECLINTIKGFSIPAGLPWHLVDEVYIPINCGDEFHWVLALIILKERHIRVYDSMSRRRRSEPSFEIQKLAKILSTYLDMSGFLDHNVRTGWSTIEAYRDKMDNPFDVQYVEGIAQQTIDSLNCGPFVVAYVEYLSDVLQVPNDVLDAGLLRKRYAALLWKIRRSESLEAVHSTG
ncbi:hypothetical protein CQW23_17149 [Capsicum baccatum]|uniref:Ubiquitin-like protease family profile domain-containing protein n=1 Tax=Capsicum baccatum TaxID=33114 RepID=A0A2G2WCZ3_CAPBA|nr:hypothetical protein CQW23_17149 [Capsicum baccatum]